MKTILKTFFPEKKKYDELLNFFNENNILFTSEYKFPEYLIIVETNQNNIDKIYENFGFYIFSNEDKTLDDVFHEVVINTDITISGAESCTGGLISKYLTDRAGASKYFKYSVVSYSNEAKIRILNVEEDSLEEKGSVSKSTVIGMLEGLEYIYPTNISFAVTGVAGPDGGTENKPVGTVFIGIMQYGRRDIEKFFFEGNRWEIRRYSAWTVLLKMLNKIRADI
jgi:nicotinamide-nucleotide amidase